jgi:hypothetical protein
VVLQGVGDIAQEANIGNRISRAEKNASCFDRIADVLDLREALQNCLSECLLGGQVFVGQAG